MLSSNYGRDALEQPPQASCLAQEKRKKYWRSAKRIRKDALPLLTIRRPSAFVPPSDAIPENEEEAEQGKPSEFINFNISGRKFRVLRETLLKFHVCRAAENSENSDATQNADDHDFAVKRERMPLLEQIACTTCVSEPEKLTIPRRFLAETDEFFFDRCDRIFESILDYYRLEELHFPTDVCPQKFLSELKFWKIESQLLAACCAGRLPIDSSAVSACRVTIADETRNSVDVPCMNGGLSSSRVLPLRSFSMSVEEEDPYKAFEGVSLENLRRTIWILIEEPVSSRKAMAYGFFSGAVIFLSILGLMMASMKRFQNSRGDPQEFLKILEIICVSWFTFEYVFRLAITAERLKFLKTPLNMVDLLSILPFYVERVIEVAGVTSETLANLAGPLLMMRILRVLRVARVLKLARYSGGLKTFGTSLKNSRKEVGLLFMFIGTNVLLSSTVVYYFEKDVENTKFTSIPETFWWCIITMTTVGYGDLTPRSLGGRVIASLTGVSGVIVLAFPITIIVENFNKCYKSKGSQRDSDSLASSRTRSGVRGFRGMI